MADLTLTADDRDAVKQILLAERDRGVTHPLLPADVDLDGDGICDAFGLNDAGEVVVVSGARLEHTVYHSEGDDIRLEDGGA